MRNVYLVFYQNFKLYLHFFIERARSYFRTPVHIGIRINIFFKTYSIFNNFSKGISPIKIIGLKNKIYFYGRLSAVFFIINTTVPCLAAQNSTVMPVRISQLYDKILFTLQQHLFNFYKNGIQKKFINTNHVEFISSKPCPDGSKNSPTSFMLEREKSFLPDGRQQIIERLNANTCQSNKEIFSFTRIGQQLSESADEDLLIGKLPNYSNSDIYKLNLDDKKLQMEINRHQKQTKFFISILLQGEKLSVETNLEETEHNNVLSENSVRFEVKNNGQYIETVTTQFIWNLDPINLVPKQYLYINAEEVNPYTYLNFQNRLFTNNLFSFVDMQFKF